MSIKWNELTVNQWKPVLQCLMITNEENLKKCILKIYEFQTNEEKKYHIAKEENELGFNKVDAEEMSKIAEKLLRGEELTKCELAKSKNKMLKYWKQIMYVCKDSLKKSEERQKALEQAKIELQIDRIKKCSEEGISCDYCMCSECEKSEKSL